MCGICGVYSLAFGASDLRLFRQLLYLNEIRGRDATGIVRIGKNPTSTFWVKDTIPSSDFLRNPEAMKHMKSDGVYGYIGHARSATVGKVTTENAHPFDFPKVVGVHNGTIRKLFKHDEKHETDSEAIFHCIDELGLKDALEEFSAKDSAYTLNWVDKEKQTLRWITNGRRPIHFTYVYGRNTLLWSSMSEALDMVVAYNSLTASGWNEGDKEASNKIFTLNPHDVMTLKLGSTASSCDIEHVDVDTEKPGKPVWSSSTGMTSSFEQSWAGRSGYEEFWADVDDDDLEHLHGTTKAKEKDSRPFRPTEWVEKQGYWFKVYKDTRVPVVNKGTTGAEAKKDKDDAPFEGHTPFGEDTPQFLLPAPGKDGKGKASSKVVDGVLSRAEPAPKYHFEAPKSASEISYRLSLGCMVCSTKYKLEEFNLIQESTRAFKFRWWSREAFCCPDCMSEETVRLAYFGEGV